MRNNARVMPNELLLRRVHRFSDGVCRFYRNRQYKWRVTNDFAREIGINRQTLNALPNRENNVSIESKLSVGRYRVKLAGIACTCWWNIKQGLHATRYITNIQAHAFYTSLRGCVPMCAAVRVDMVSTHERIKCHIAPNKYERCMCVCVCVAAISSSKYNTMHNMLY